MRKIIINADDFGINPIVTQEIEQLIENGAISSTTIMPNGECLEEVKRFVLKHPNISFGVHLCLSEYGSITKASSLLKNGLIDKGGNFINKQIFKIKYFDEDLKQAIKEELNAQIAVIRSLGVPISHADSHHHVHTIYQLRSVFSDVLQSNGIDKIRLGGDFYSWRSRKHLSLWFRRVQLNRYYRSLFKTTDYFLSYSNYWKYQNKLVDNCIVELCCHPGHPGLLYQKEMEEVEKKELLINNNNLISYHEL